MISIIVPVYNVEQYLTKCLQSILIQTYQNFELILVNDGSTDNSLVICEEYKKKDSRIRIINKENGGLSSARNAGLKEMKGDYIVFIDSDDWIEKDYLQKLFDSLLDNNADIVQCNFIKEDIHGRTLQKFCDNKVVTEGKNFIKNLYNRKTYLQTVVVWNKIYRKEIFTNTLFDEGIHHEDEAIIHELLYKASKIVCIDNILYHYIVRQNSITQQRLSPKSLDAIYALEKRMIFFKNNNEYILLSMTMPIYFRLLVKFTNKFKNSKNSNYGEIVNELESKIKACKSDLKINKFMSLQTKVLWYLYRLNPKIAYIYSSCID